ncbi:MAG: response regulator transcription factor [Clostridiales bacterium]
MILILDDHPLARQGLSSIIQMYKRDEEILQAGTVRESISLMEKNQVGLAFIDINLGKENGLSLLTWIREKKYDCKIFIITSSSRQSDFTLAQEMAVDAYVLKEAFIDEITYGLQTVERGAKFYSAALVDRMGKYSEDEKALSALTERELDVFLLLGQGYDNDKISKDLYISLGTAKKHISSILAKLQLNNRVEAVLFASKNSYSIQMALNKAIRADLRKESRAI